MDIDALMVPVHPEEPCGADLKKARDPDYLRVFIAAQHRLPEAYVKRAAAPGDDDVIFDPRSVDFAEEAEALDGLLERSRDIRYLMLRLQFALLSNRMPPAADALEAVAALLETFDADVHPVKQTERQVALNGVENVNTVVLPLQFCGLIGSRDVSLRRIRVARGDGTQLSNESGLDLDQQLGALASQGNSEAVAKSHDAARRMARALDRIAAACRSRPSDAFEIKFPRLRPVIDEIVEVIERARPDLAQQARDADTPEPEPEEGPDDAQSAGAGGSSAAPVPPVRGPKVTDHAHARRLLEACEAYYRSREPSSPALLLVAQARDLIGRPLIEALEILMPQKAQGARVDFGPGEGFTLDFQRLRSLSGAFPPTEAEPASDAPDIVMEDGRAAAAAIESVEAYFRAAERSSPVPILLRRARTYLDFDFETIVNELLPKPEET